MKLKKKAVFRIFEKSQVPLTLTQVRHRLGIRKKQQLVLKSFLLELVVQGKLVRHHGKYGLPPSHTDSPKHPKTQDEVTPQKIKHGPTGSVGMFSRTSQGFGFVDVGPGSPDIYVPQEKQNGAMDGDRVEVELFKSRRPGRQRGKIVNILERSQQRFIAHLRRGKSVTLAIPVNENSPLGPVIIKAEDDVSDAASGALIEGTLIPDTSKSKNVFGKILRVLPETSVDELAFELILSENQIQTKFSPDALEQAKNFPTRVTYSASSGRRDLRDLGMVTIDGEDARDFDDAVFAEKLSSGNFRLWVSIADVAHYVRPNDAVDQDAYQRGTSTYFPTHAIPMLPEALSNSLCSLRPNVNRLTMTCEMEINPSGEVIRSDVYESVIRSQARLTYTEVTNFLEGETSTIRKPTVQAALTVMQELAVILGKKRHKRGAIEFAFPEFRALLNDKREVLGFEKKYQSISMKLIEQFMLEANETVARFCVEHNLPSLYRVHEKPDVIKLEKLRDTFWYFGVPYKASKLHKAGQINQLLEKLKGHASAAQMQVLLLRCMAQACYRVDNGGHFGLSAEFYTHFTSPIRRYPDLIVHRAIKAKLKGERNKPQKEGQMGEEVASHLSQQERRADVAERQSINLVKTILMERYQGQTLPAEVVSITPAGAIVEFSELQVEAFLPVEMLKDDYYQHDPVRLALVGMRNNRLVQAGEQMQVTVLRTDRIERIIELELESWSTA